MVVVWQLGLNLLTNILLHFVAALIAKPKVCYK